MFSKPPPLSYFTPSRKRSRGPLQLPIPTKTSCSIHLPHLQKMKLGCVLLPLLLGLLVLASVDEAKLFAGNPSLIGIPEHRCQKTIGRAPCKQERCEQECSKEPQGSGECVDAVCKCSFFCPGPPV